MHAFAIIVRQQLMTPNPRGSCPTLHVAARRLELHVDLSYSSQPVHSSSSTTKYVKETLHKNSLLLRKASATAK